MAREVGPEVPGFFLFGEEAFLRQDLLFGPLRPFALLAADRGIPLLFFALPTEDHSLDLVLSGCGGPGSG